MKKNPLRIIWLILGYLCLGIGTVGIVLPILPTVPFYMATVFCFAKGSERMYRWFLGTKLYRKYLDSFVKEKSMTLRTKAGIILTVTIVMGIGFLMMGRVPAARVLLAVVWLCHLVFFIFWVKTIREGGGQKE